MTGDPLRLFLGVRVSMDTVRALAEVVDELRGRGDLDVRWAPPASYHVTLAFLGWTRPEAVHAVRDRVEVALAGAREQSFSTRGLGAFPDLGRARVLWAGIDGDGGGLADLAARLGQGLEPLGFPVEARPFHPHVTLGRLKKAADARGLLEGFTEKMFRKTLADSVVLYESTRIAKGSEYRVVASWALESASRGRSRQTKAVEEGNRDPDPAAVEPIDTAASSTGAGAEEHPHGEGKER